LIHGLHYFQEKFSGFNRKECFGNELLERIEVRRSLGNKVKNKRAHGSATRTYDYVTGLVVMHSWMHGGAPPVCEAHGCPCIEAWSCDVPAFMIKRVSTSF